MYWISTIKLKITAQKQGNFTNLKKPIFTSFEYYHTCTYIKLVLLLD
jgi:hypothetical protein